MIRVHIPVVRANQPVVRATNQCENNSDKERGQLHRHLCKIALGELAACADCCLNIYREVAAVSCKVWVWRWAEGLGCQCGSMALPVIASLLPRLSLQMALW